MPALQLSPNRKRLPVFAAGFALALALLVALGAQLSFGAPPAQEQPAALALPRGVTTTLVVSSTADSGAGTLRQALLDAASGDIITFDPAVFPPANPVTITLISALPSLSQGNVTIDAGDAGVILDGSGIGTTHQTVLLDDVSLTLDGGPNLITNGDFSADLGHWRPWDEGPGATRSLNPSDATSAPSAYEWGTVAYAGDSRTVYDTTDTSAPLDDWPYYDGSTVWMPATGGSTVEVRFWYRYGGVSGTLQALLLDGDAEQIGSRWFDWQAGWTEAVVNAVLPDDAIGVALELERDHSEHWTSGLSIGSNGNTIRSLQIVNFPGNGIALHSGAQNNTIGGDRGAGAGPLGQGNLISGNGGFGVGMWGTDTSSNTIAGNRIGTDLSGTTTWGNRYDGVHMNGPSHNQVIDNLISGNGGNGVSLCCRSDTSHNTVSGNLIGTDVSGTRGLPNGSNGVAIHGGASYNLIGGDTVGKRNLILGNRDSGVSIWGAGTMSNTVQGNYIGLGLAEVRQAFPTDMAISPDYPNDCTLYVATLSTGVHKSTDCGATWIEVNSGLTESRLMQVEIPPDAVDANTVYALAENGYLFTTTDGGVNWSLVSTTLEGIGRRNLVLSAGFTSDQTMYVAAEWWGWWELGNGPGVYKSTDGGVIWTRMVNGMSDHHVWKVIASPDPTEKETLFALTHSGIEESTDGTANWSTVASPDSDLSDLALSPVYGSDQTIYATADTGRVYASTDGGRSWNGVDALRGEPRHLALSPDYANDRTVCHGGGWNDSIYCSTDGGVTWTRTDTGLPGSLDDTGTAIVFSPNYATDRTMFIASVAGVARSGPSSRAQAEGTGHSGGWGLLRGLRDLGNRAGVSIGGGASFNTIGPDNVISNNHFGVTVNSGNSAYNVVAGNLIGTDPSGAFAQANSDDGVVMWGGHHNRIGGETAAARNVVSGSVRGDAIRLSGRSVLSNTVSGNYIGTDAGGTAVIGNVWNGVAIHGGASFNLIGGDTSSKRNVISGNETGVSIRGSDTRYNTVRGNYIGTDAGGTGAPGNSGHGVHIRGGARRNTIGQGNVIAHNGGDGVRVAGPTTIGNTITQNSIYDNDGAGIETSDGGNTELAPPIISSTDLTGGRVTGSACALCVVEVFSDEQDEGRHFEGAATADASGLFTLSKGSALTGPNIKATATDPEGNTSESSAELNWTPTSGLPMGGAVSALAVDFSKPGVVYAGVENLGLAVTSDRGASWSHVGHPPEHGIRAVVLDPTDPGIIYFSGHWGIHITGNGGEDWRVVDFGQEKPHVTALVMAPTASGHVGYAATPQGIYKTTDGWEDWLEVGFGLPEGVYISSLAIDPLSPDTVYAGTSGEEHVNGAGIFRTTDGGNTWVEMGLANLNINVVLIDPRDSQVLYVGTESGLFKTRDGGVSWFRADAGLTSLKVSIRSPRYAPHSGQVALDLNVKSLAIHPSDSTILYAGTARDGLFVTTDGGDNWSVTALANSGRPEGDVRSLVIDPFDPDIVYAGTAEGIFKVTGGGAGYVSMNTEIENSPVYAVAVDPQDSGTVYAGQFCRRDIFKTETGGSDWRWIGPAGNWFRNHTYTMEIGIDPSDPDVIYTTTVDGFFKSFDGGGSWVTYLNPLQSWHLHGLAIDPLSPNIIYVGTGAGSNPLPGAHIYKSTDGGGTWTTVDNGFPTEKETSIEVIAIDPSNTNTFYVGTSAHSFGAVEEPEALGIFKSVDGGGNWTQVNQGLMSLEIHDITIDPADSNIVYAATGEGVFKSTNGGDNWSPVSSGLPAVEVTSLIIHPSNPRVIYAGTHGQGVFKTTDGGTRWYPLHHGPPRQINALAIDSAGSVLYAASQSNGVFRAVIEHIAGVSVSAPTGQVALPGGVVTHTFTIRNTGQAVDSFDLQATSSNGWTVNIVGGPTVGPLSPGTSTTVDVEVTIPAGTPCGASDVLTLSAISQFDAGVSASASVTTGPSILGDFDCDCSVDIDDIMQVGGRWQARSGDADYDAVYDLDDDGEIVVVDIMLVAARWGETCP